MSNAVVGNIYAQIIEKVIQASQNDFEESGIDQATLAELKDKWQQRLSSYHVAQFPWDPAPVATTIQNPPPQATSSQVKQEGEASSSAAGSQQQGHGQAANGARIKAEPDYDSNVQRYPPVNGFNHAAAGVNPHLAQQRAQSLLQQQYNQQANPQQTFALPGQQVQAQRPQGIQLPGQTAQPAAQQQYPPQQVQRTSMGTAQTDGAGEDLREWSAMMASRSRLDNDRTAADATIREHIEDLAYEQDGGLMVPLSERPKVPKRKRRQRLASVAEASSSASSRPPQLDGLDDEDEEKFKIEDEIEEEDVKDEDAINSDLDDSEDELNQAAEEEDEGAAVNEAILCTYDKVQRVKNKWKCTLKDGILSTKGKDYLFHKAQGEMVEIEKKKKTKQ